MCTEALNETLRKLLQNRPKAIKVGTELWKKLYEEGRIKPGPVKNKEHDAIQPGIEHSFLDGDIAIEVSQSLGPCEYELPPEDR